MEKKVRDMLYTLGAKIGQDQYSMNRELNLKKRLLAVIQSVKEKEELMSDKRINSFFKKMATTSLTVKDLMDVEEAIETFKNKKIKSSFVFKRPVCDISLEGENMVRERCNELSIALKHLNEASDSLKELLEKDLQGEDIFDIKNIHLFQGLSLYHFDQSDKEILISLYQKWATKIALEYQEIKKDQAEVQSIGPLLNIKDLPKSNYPNSYDGEILEEDIKEQAIYIRNLMKQGEYELANSLMNGNRESMLLRILYDIEYEIGLLESEETFSSEEVEIVQELKNELLKEKKSIQQTLGGAKQWIK